MVTVKFEKGFMPVTAFFPTRELAEAYKRKVEKMFPGTKVVIEG